MKTTIEIPDLLFRKAKSCAAELGQSLNTVMTEALEEKLARNALRETAPESSRMAGFGAPRRLHRETARIQRDIDEAFERIESEERA